MHGPPPVWGRAATGYRVNLRVRRQAKGKDSRHAGPALDSRHRPHRPARYRLRVRSVRSHRETGAGKSILLDAFALALGARGDVTLVRQGAEQGQGTAAFALPSAHPGAA